MNPHAEPIDHLGRAAFQPVDEWFTATADACPGRIAIQQTDGAVTFGDLAASSQTIARALIGLGAAPHDIVAIATEDRARFAAAMTGVLRAGCAFANYPTDLPEARLRPMFERARARLVLCDPRSAARFAPVTAGVRREAAVACGDFELASYRLDAPNWIPGPPPASAVAGDGRPPRTPDDFAYVFYTSGSTGIPKAIAGRLGGIDHFVRWEIGACDLAHGPRVSQFVHPSFDAMMRDVYVPLCSGGTMCVPAADDVRDPDRLCAWLAAQAIEVVHAVPTLLRFMLSAKGDHRLPALRHVLLSGERLLPADVAQWRDRHGDTARLVNLYGASETTMAKFAYVVRPEDATRRTIPVGTPIPGARAILLDESMRPCRPGTVGELYTRTPFMSRGYCNDPEQTAQAFIANPLAPSAGDLIYRSGDFARLRADGRFEFLGRRDDQVKISGVRIECGEVEAAIRAFPGVTGAAVLVRSGGAGSGSVDSGRVESAGDRATLVAYVSPRNGLDVGRLRSHLTSVLSTAALPAAIVPLDALPLTANGKVDRQALPAPEESSPAAARDDVWRTPAEELIGSLWQELLPAGPAITPDTNFFARGGHSLIAAQIMARVQRTFGVEVPLRALFDAPTVPALAGHVERARGDAGAARPPRPGPRPPRIPLSFGQQRLWFLTQLDPASTAYNCPAALRLRGAVSVAALRQALTTVVARHEILRTRIVAEDGRPEQCIDAASPVPMPLIDLERVPSPRRERIVDRLARAEARRPFDLARGPLLRAAVIRVADEEVVFLLTLHHLICDGWSFGVLSRELMTAYEAARPGAKTAAVPLPVQYADVAIWQREWLNDERLGPHLAWWREQLRELPVLELPAPELPGGSAETDSPRARAMGHVPFRLDASLTTALRTIGREEGTTLFMTLLAALDVALAKYSGQLDIAVGAPVANRRHVETEGLIGFFVNTVVLRTRFADADTFRALLHRVRGTVLEAYDHQDAPFDRVVDELRLADGLRQAPLFRVMALMENTPRSATRVSDVMVTDITPPRHATKFDLVFSMYEQDGAVACMLDYAANALDAGLVNDIVSHWRGVLARVVERRDLTIGDLRRVEEHERAAIVAAGTGAAVRREGVADVVAGFEAQVRERPGAVAVVADDGVWTYAAFNARVNQLARALRAAGVRREVRVAVCLPRSASFVIALWSVWKAGGVYVPVDPAYPAARVNYVLRDADVRVVMTDAAGAAVIAAAMRDGGAPPSTTSSRDGDAAGTVPIVLRVDEERCEATEDLGLAIAPAQAAYVIYTSGSTGQPKGAVNTHAGLWNRLAWLQGVAPIGAADAVMHKTPCSFDVSLPELAAPLVMGARQVVCRPEGHRDPAYLIDVIQQQAVTSVHFVPSMLQVFLQAPGVERCATLRQVHCSGEALWPAVVTECASRLPAATLHNLYGPTEAAIEVTSWTRPVAWRGAQVPIGRPIANTQTYVLDASGALAPHGVAGELYLGGINLARGYLHRPGLTATRFVPDAFSGEPGARLYRTGDRVRWNAAGELEYLGRFDHQIKLRGHRIELGEIEVALTALTDVRQSVVVLREDVPGMPHLVAYVVREGDASRSDVAAAIVSTADAWTETVRARLAARLPAYMVPAVIVPLAALPLSPNGKIERRALPAPPSPSLAAAQVAPTTPREALLAAIWARLLKQAAVSIDANFFALGGDSILSIQVVARAAQAGLRLTPRQVFDHPTVRGLAAVAEEIETAAVADRAGASFALTPIQQTFVTTPRVVMDYYNQAVLLTVAPGVAGRSLVQAVEALEANHGLLRARFVQEPDGWRGAIAPATATRCRALSVVALERVPAAAVDRVQTRVCAQWQRSLCLAAGPVWRAGLVTRAHGERRLLLAAHHLIVDGVSWRILLEDLQQALAQARRGLPVTLPPPSSSFAQWSTAVQTAATRWPVAAEQAWWRATAAAAVAPLPCDAPLIDAAARRAANRIGTARTVTVSLSAAATTRLVRRTALASADITKTRSSASGPAASSGDAAQATGSGTEAILLTSVAGAIGRWSGAPAVRVALEGHGREELPAVDVSRIVGWFTTIYPVTLPATGAPAARLQAVTEQLASVPRRGFGYGLLRTHVADPAVRAERLADVPPEISFNYLGQLDAVWDDAALLHRATEPAAPTQDGREQRRAPLEIGAEVRDGSLRIHWTYSHALHHRSTIHALADECLREIERLLDAGDEDAFAHAAGQAARAAAHAADQRAAALARVARLSS